MANINELLAQVAGHQLTQDCPDLECSICGIRDCPSNEPFHYHHDGCPACYKKNTESPVDNTAKPG